MEHRRRRSRCGKRGVPAFGSSCWQRLCARHAGLPAREDLPVLTSRDAARLCQLGAPGRVLGTFPQPPRLQRALLLAVADGDLVAEADAVDACVERHSSVVRPMRLATDHETSRPVTFWLHLQETPAWTGFARVGDEVCLRVGDHLLLPG